MELKIFVSIIVFITFFTSNFCAEKPNILFVLTDDLGYGEVGAYPCQSPHGRISTPNFDAFSKQSMMFTDAYAGDAVCAPSRTTLMTGKHTGHTTIRGNKGYEGHDFPLQESDITVAQVLKKGGYNTAAVGKWGLGWVNTTGAPLNKGFDYYFGQLDQSYCHNYYPPFVWENKEQIMLPLNKDASRDKCMKTPQNCNYTIDLFTNAAMEWLKKQSDDTPWFLYLTWTIPHAGGWKGTEESGAPVPNDGIYSGKNWSNVIEIDHAAQITEWEDRDFGRILDLLKQLGFEDNTVVFFASDNGAHNEGGHSYKFFNSSGPLRGFKRSLYEGGIRSPSMVRFPGKIKPGISNFYWYFPDFLPTAADLADIPKDSLPKGIDGVSIVPTLFGKEQNATKYLYFEFCTNHKWGHAVRSGKWKAVSFSLDEEFELYDVENDIHEDNNLASQYPDIVKMMNEYATEAHTDDPNWPKQNCLSSIEYEDL